MLPKIKYFVWVLLLILPLACLVTYNNAVYESRLKAINSDNPLGIASSFIGAIRRGDYDFAKEFVAPEQQKNLNDWITVSGHEPFDCPIEWSRGLGVLNQTVAGGGASGYEIENDVTIVDASYGCTPSGPTIKIKEAVVKYNGAQWKIAGWEKICISHVYKNDWQESCYP